MSNGKIKSSALTASLLALATGAVSAGDFKTISKSGDAGSQISEFEPGTFVVKCVGAALGGENDCGAVDGSHECAGLGPAGEDNSDNEWAYMTLDQCANHPNGKFLFKGDDGAVVLSKTEFQFKFVEE